MQKNTEKSTQHKSNTHLPLFTNENKIIPTSFTNDIKDYSLAHLKACYKTHLYDRTHRSSKFKKIDYFKKVSEFCLSQQKLSQKVPQLLKIQSYFRGYLLRHLKATRGVACIYRAQKPTY